MSRSIKIDESYRVETSTTGCSLILDKKGEVNPKTGNPIQVFDQWFYTDVKACLKKYCALQINLECSSIQEVISKIEALEKKIDEMKEIRL